MTIDHAGLRGVALGAMACLALPWLPAVQAQVKLEYKYPEGRKLSYKTTLKTYQSWTLMGMEIEGEQQDTVVSSRTFGKRRADGTLPVEEKVESFRTALSLPGGITVTYDSTDPNTKIDNAQLAFLGEMFKIEAGKRYTVVIDGQNKVKAIEGAEKMLERVDKLSPPARDALRSQLEGAKLKTLFEQEHRNLPDVLARPGEPWERSEVNDIGNGRTLTFHKKYEYLGTEKKGDRTLDKISSKVADVALKQDPDFKTSLKVVKSDLRVESSEGTILFDREEGCVISVREKTRIKGAITVLAGPDSDLPGNVDLTLDSNKQLQPAGK